METEDVVELIQHYRHDVVNQLQVIQGYIGLENYNKAESNMTEFLEYFQQERKLLHLNVPNVFLWFLKFTISNDNFKLGYDIDIENKTLKQNDFLIVEKLELIMRDIRINCSSDQCYQLEIEFKDNIDYAEINVYIDIASQETNDETDFAAENIALEINESERMYRFHVSVDNEVN